MAGSGRFALDLIEQHWCGPNPELDPSAGGRLRLVINGATIMDGEDQEVGVARSALAISRTLLHDHTLDNPVAEQLVLHDCGFATMLMSCGIGANWWVRHEEDSVRIDGVVRFDTTYGGSAAGSFSTHDQVEWNRDALSKPHDGTAFPEAACVVPYAEYAREVIRLAEATLDFAAGSEKRFDDEFDLSQWLGWQTEIREILTAVAVRRS